MKRAVKKKSVVVFGSNTQVQTVMDIVHNKRLDIGVKITTICICLIRSNNINAIRELANNGKIIQLFCHSSK